MAQIAAWERYTLFPKYHLGHGISLAYEHGEAGTEDLRQAMVHYRSLFEDLLEVDGEARVDDRQEAEVRESR